MTYAHVLAVVLVSFFGVTAASAQSHAVVGKDYEGIGGTGICPVTTYCIVKFLPNPVQSAIKINRVECQIGSSQPIYQVLLAVYATSSDNSQMKTKAIDIANSIQTAQNNWVTTVNTETATFLGKNRYPRIRATSASGIAYAMTCSINGVIVP